jgi:Holliday junction DNA helicase RuvA
VCGLDTADALRQAVSGGDAAFLQTAPGVGKRTAERIIVELRDRLPSGDGAGGGGGATSVVGEAREGLLGLGFAPDEVAAALNGAPPELDGAALVRHALTRLRR